MPLHLGAQALGALALGDTTIGEGWMWDGAWRQVYSANDMRTWPVSGTVNGLPVSVQSVPVLKPNTLVAFVGTLASQYTFTRSGVRLSDSLASSTVSSTSPLPVSVATLAQSGSIDVLVGAEYNSYSTTGQGTVYATTTYAATPVSGEYKSDSWGSIGTVTVPAGVTALAGPVLTITNDSTSSTRATSVRAYAGTDMGSMGYTEGITTPYNEGHLVKVTGPVTVECQMLTSRSYGAQYSGVLVLAPIPAGLQ